LIWLSAKTDVNQIYFDYLLEQILIINLSHLCYKILSN